MRSSQVSDPPGNAARRFPRPVQPVFLPNRGLLDTVLAFTGVPFDSLRGILSLTLREVPRLISVAVGCIARAESAGAGGEVPRPLATVVIGGVIPSALFVLMILPILLTCRRPHRADPSPLQATHF